MPPRIARIRSQDLGHLCRIDVLGIHSPGHRTQQGAHQGLSPSPLRLFSECSHLNTRETTSQEKGTAGSAVAFGLVIQGLSWLCNTGIRLKTGRHQAQCAAGAHGIGFTKNQTLRRHSQKVSGQGRRGGIRAAHIRQDGARGPPTGGASAEHPSAGLGAPQTRSWASPPPGIVAHGPQRQQVTRRNRDL